MKDTHENIFGKMRGRFDEEAARRCDRSLKYAAMAAIVPMPTDELGEFIELFNKVFEARGLSIERHES